MQEEKEEEVFRPFTAPREEVYTEKAAAEDEDTIKITRSVMTDAVPENDADGEEDIENVSAVFEFDTDEDDEDNAPDEEEIPPERQNPDVLKYRELYSMFSEPSPAEKPEDIVVPEKSEPAIEEVFFDRSEDSDEDDTDEDEDIADEIDEDEDDVPFEDYMPVRSPLASETKKAAPEKPAGEKPDYSSFKFPPIDLLAKGKDSEDPTIELEIQENGEKLIDALAQFNVRASVRSVDRGPRITRYEIVPARGVRVNSVISLFDDIALNLAAEGIRMEAPIPGKSAIGVEIPNKHPTTVMLRDLLETEEFINESSKTFSCVGKDVTGNPVFGDMSKMPHILVAGATGMGKSVCINSILISILYKARPDEVKFIMIDPKTVEFTKIGRAHV